MEITAFAPGHISGFFEPVFRKQDFERSGSRGGGINLSLGAISSVGVSSTPKQTIDIFVNNRRTTAPVTRLAVQYLIEDTPLSVTIKTTLELPQGQGFGMSGASALSATLALAKLARIPQEKAIKAAHYAEVQLKTGLSDVIASSFGGIEIRREPGLPPWGIIEHIPGELEIVIAVIDKRIETRKILDNPLLLQDIALYGRICTKKILEEPSIENFFLLSQEFALKTKLASPKIQNAIKAVSSHGIASMCMLGNSVFAYGSTKDIATTLSSFGKVYVCPINHRGAYVFENSI